MLGECWGRETSIKVVSNFSNTIPDMKFEIKEVLVAGDRIIVRGEVAGPQVQEAPILLCLGLFS